MHNMAKKMWLSVSVLLLVLVVVNNRVQFAESADSFRREGSRGQLVFAQSPEDVILSNNQLDLQVGRRGSVMKSLLYKRNGMPDVELLDRHGKSPPGYWDLHWETGNASTISSSVPSSRRNSKEQNVKCKFGGTDGAAWVNLDGGPGDEMLGVTFKPAAQQTNSARAQPVNTILHYAMREDMAGAYCTLLVEHMPEQPSILLTELRLVLKLNPLLFDYSFVADDRQRFMPSRRDISGKNSSQLAFKEARLITRSTNEEFVKTVDHKYQFSVESKDAILYGWISTKLKIGVWIISPNKWEYLGGGPFKQDLSVQTGPNLLTMLHSRHYGTPAIELNNYDEWQKAYGPFLIYVNDGKDIDDLILDAKARAAQEAQAWPYKWVPSSEYPRHEDRGTVTGRVVTQDPFEYEEEEEVKTGSGTWIGLTETNAETNNWEDEVKGYQYWNVTNDEGEFTIYNVRPGTYILQSLKPGMLVDSSVMQTVTVEENWVLNVGAMVLRPKQKGPTVWEIGIPDRSAAEFMIPEEIRQEGKSSAGAAPSLSSKFTTKDAFRQYGLWEKFAKLYPEKDPVFIVGQSDWSKDWFFAHVIRSINVSTQREIVFHVDHILEGDYTLRLAIAGAHQASVEVRLNNPYGSPLHDTGPFGKDNALARAGIHGHYHEFSISISHMNFHYGRNSIFLHQRKKENELSYVMYDYIRLEAPAGSTSQS